MRTWLHPSICRRSAVAWIQLAPNVGAINTWKVFNTTAIFQISPNPTINICWNPDWKFAETKMNWLPNTHRWKIEPLQLAGEQRVQLACQHHWLQTLLCQHLYHQAHHDHPHLTGDGFNHLLGSRSTHPACVPHIQHWQDNSEKDVFSAHQLPRSYQCFLVWPA